MGRLYWRNAEGAERIRATILFDGGNDDYGFDDGVESDGNYVELRQNDSECAEGAKSNDYCCSEVDTTNKCFHRNGQDEVG